MQAIDVTFTNSEDASDEVSSLASDGGGSSTASPHRQYNAAMANKLRQRRMRRIVQQQKSSSNMPTDPPATGLDQFSSVRNPPPPPLPPKLNKKRVPNNIFTEHSDPPLYHDLPPPPPPPPTRLSQGRSVPENIETKKKKSQAIAVAFNEEEFFPNLQSGLNDDDVRDAANYTSIQFNCNSTSGEVEVFDENSPGVFDVSGGGGDRAGLDSWKNEVWLNDVELRSTRNDDDQIFEQKGARNMTAFLTPNRMSRAGLMAPAVGSEEDETPKDIRGDSPRGVSSPDAPGLSHETNPGSSRMAGQWRGTQLLQEDDIDEDVRQSMVFQALRKQMVTPSPQLEELLKQIHRDFFQQIDRTFATRRKNACGALKILAAKEENRLKICWSAGVLTAIASVLQDVHAVIHDEQTRLANTEARNRIISALLNLSVNKKNRLLIVNTPGLLESIAQTILNDEGEGRQGCCTVLLYLSKTAETRRAIAKSRGLMDAISKVIEVPKWVAPSSSQHQQQQTTKYFDTDTMATHSTSHDEDMSCTSSEHLHKNSTDDDNSAEDELETKKTLTFTLSYEKFVDTSEPVEIDYDLDPNKFLHGARLTAFACLLCLVKSKETVSFIAKEEAVIEALIGVSRKFSSPSHVRALAILAHLTRHPQNCHLLVFKYVALLPLLQEATSSPEDEGRRYALCALQNLSIDTSCRAPVAHSPNMIKALTYRLKHYSSNGELVAAVATLQNLADEPANLIQFTIVKHCVASIIEIARSDEKGDNETDVAAFLAKNTLVTLSHWFRRIATSGSERITIGTGGRGQHILHGAVLAPTTYQQWQ